MKGLFIPEITVEMFRNGCLESIEALMAEGKVYDIDYTRWIPCAERLPEDYRDVLVCDGVDMFVGWCELDGLSKKWHSLDDNFDYDTPIIAWMPLPELYKAECEKGDI